MTKHASHGEFDVVRGKSAIQRRINFDLNVILVRDEFVGPDVKSISCSLRLIHSFATKKTNKNESNQPSKRKNIKYKPITRYIYGISLDVKNSSALFADSHDGRESSFFCNYSRFIYYKIIDLATNRDNR